MDEATKLSFKLLTLLTQRVIYVESTQVQILKWLSDIADGDAETQQRAYDIAARIESSAEQVEALLAAVRAALDE